MRRPLLFLLPLLAAGVLGAAAPAPKAAPPPPLNTCMDCHLALDHEVMSPPARKFAEDIHASSGFTCVFCHGGDARQDDQELAHDPRRGFRGKPSAREIPELCGRCVENVNGAGETRRWF